MSDIRLAELRQVLDILIDPIVSYIIESARNPGVWWAGSLEE